MPAAHVLLCMTHTALYRTGTVILMTSDALGMKGIGLLLIFHLDPFRGLGEIRIVRIVTIAAGIRECLPFFHLMTIFTGIGARVFFQNAAMMFIIGKGILGKRMAVAADLRHRLGGFIFMAGAARHEFAAVSVMMTGITIALVIQMPLV